MLTIEVRFGDTIKEVPAFMDVYYTSPNGRAHHKCTRHTPVSQDGIKFEQDSLGRWHGYKITRA